jgi:hypothetical protein
VPNAENVNGIPADLEEDAVDSSPLAMKQLAKFPRVPLAFRSKPTPLRVIL